MEARPEENVDVAIIGAGWYGLVAARTYLRLRPGINLVIIDSDTSVGGVWSSSRLYPNLVAQVNLGLFNYIDTPMPATGMNSKGQVTGRMIHDYLQKYAEDHDLLRRIRFNTFVTSVKRGDKGWNLHFKDSPKSLHTEKLMVATGVTSIPNMPEHLSEDVSIPIIHSKDLGQNFEDLESSKYHHVMVVGAAKSAYDAVYLLLTMGKKVTWVIRDKGAGPLAILPSELFGWWTSIGVASTRLMTGLSPSILNSKGLLYWLFQANFLGRWVTGIFWDLVTESSEVHAGFHKGDHVAGLKPEIKGKSIFWSNSGLGVVTLPDFWSTIHQGDVSIVRDELHGLKGGTMSFKSGRQVRTDFMVNCTGWGDHFAMFDDDLKYEIGLPVKGQRSHMNERADRDWRSLDHRAQSAVDRKLPFLAKGPVLTNPAPKSFSQQHWRLWRRVVPLRLAKNNDRSLVILGQIHTIQTPLVASVQVFWAILYLLGELALPSEEKMVEEIAEWNAWTRKRYLNQGRKFPYSLYDFLPYIESLCRDLGVNSRRKSNIITEYFSPYRPSDFSRIIDEYLAQEPEQAVDKGKPKGLHIHRVFALYLAVFGTFFVFAKYMMSAM